MGLSPWKLFTFDAVLLDLDMPVLDGHGVLQEMTGGPPVVLITASDARLAMASHPDKIFGAAPKPVHPERFLAIVGEAATAGRAAREGRPECHDLPDQLDPLPE